MATRAVAFSGSAHFWRLLVASGWSQTGFTSNGIGGARYPSEPATCYPWQRLGSFDDLCLSSWLTSGRGFHRRLLERVPTELGGGTVVTDP